MTTYNEKEAQRAIADKALEMIFLTDPFAIVAGGAPRDWYFGNLAADIDLFFSMRENVTAATVRKVVTKAGFTIVQERYTDELPEWYKVNPSIRGVLDTVVDGFAVQLILVSGNTFSVVEQFPLSICKAWYKNGKIVLEKDFMRGVQRKAIFKTNELYANGHVYLKKILAKFPDYKYYESREKLALAVLDNY